MLLPNKLNSYDRLSDRGNLWSSLGKWEEGGVTVWNGGLEDKSQLMLKRVHSAQKIKAGFYYDMLKKCT